MKQYRTVYPLFEVAIKDIIKLVARSIELEKHPASTIVLLSTIISMLEKLLEVMFDKPSLELINLKDSVNTTFKKCSSAHVINLRIDLCENPDLSKSSLIIFKMY